MKAAIVCQLEISPELRRVFETQRGGEDLIKVINSVLVVYFKGNLKIEAIQIQGEEKVDGDQ